MVCNNYIETIKGTGVHSLKCESDMLLSLLHYVFIMVVQEIKC